MIPANLNWNRLAAQLAPIAIGMVIKAALGAGDVPEVGGGDLGGDDDGGIGETTPGAERPTPNTSLPDRVTKELPPGEIRTPQETAQARNFFERNRDAAEQWYEQRTGEPYPDDATNAGHNPRAIGDGGDPLHIEPEFDGPNAKHMIPGADGLTDAQRWGMRGGRPRGR